MRSYPVFLCRQYHVCELTSLCFAREERTCSVLTAAEDVPDMADKFGRDGGELVLVFDGQCDVPELRAGPAGLTAMGHPAFSSISSGRILIPRPLETIEMMA